MLDDATRRKPIYLQLQQKASDRVHIELFMSNGEYPTPSKHKFSCNTKTSPSVHIKLPPFTQPAHWLIRVQPSEPMSVWSKSLEYSLRLYERTLSSLHYLWVPAHLIVLTLAFFSVFPFRDRRDANQHLL